jgi:hypothetical protein
MMLARELDELRDLNVASHAYEPLLREMDMILRCLACAPTAPSPDVGTHLH